MYEIEGNTIAELLPAMRRRHQEEASKAKPADKKSEYDC